MKGQKRSFYPWTNRSLQELISKISAAVGADEQKTRSLMGDIDGLKKQFARLTPQEADKLLSMAGREKSEQILRMIAGNGVTGKMAGKRRRA